MSQQGRMLDETPGATTPHCRTSKKSSVTTFASKFGLALGSILISLAVIELGLRVTGFEPRRPAVTADFDGWAIPDARMGWVNRAGTWKSAEPGNTPMTFEADGRGADPAGHKPASLARVLVVVW